jgi:transcriptional regulator of heat shock response
MNAATTTTEFQARKELEKHFYANAVAAFDVFIQQQNEQQFYLHVLEKLKQDKELTAELPELKTLTKSAAVKVCEQLAQQAAISAAQVWQLAANTKRLFTTTIREVKTPQSLLACFEVEYKAKHVQASINVKTHRRNITVKVIGSDSAAEQLHKALVVALLKK